MSAEKSTPRDDVFFVGYLGAPKQVVLFALAAGASLLGAAAALAFTLAWGTDPIEPRTFAPDTTLNGVVELDPYPLLRMAPSEKNKLGHTVMLAGDGKEGAQGKTAAFAGKAVKIDGFKLSRGSIEMLIVGEVAAIEASEAGLPAEAANLGRWRLSGEICDGKCAAGAMNPGTGLAHKACANLCVTGGLPPILVTKEPVEGSSFFLLANTEGKSLAKDTWEHLVARPVTLAGDLERRGDVLVFKADLSSAAYP